MIRRMISKPLVLLLILCHFQLISCDNDEATKPEVEQPSLPPAQSMTIDLSFFGGSAQKAGLTTQQLTHFQQAALRVLVISGVVVLVTGIPAAVFAVAVSQDPVLETDGKWHWYYTYTGGGQNIQAELIGWINENEAATKWEMHITRANSNPPLEDFVWFDGTWSLVDSTGHWDIYDPANTEVHTKMLQIDWAYQGEDNATLFFTCVKPGGNECFDSVTYLANGNNRTVQYYDYSEREMIDIYWDKVTEAGYLIDPTYNSGAQSCWSGETGHPNIDCE